MLFFHLLNLLKHLVSNVYVVDVLACKEKHFSEKSLCWRQFWFGVGVGVRSSSSTGRLILIHFNSR
jgi:hypothetical protein